MTATTSTTDTDADKPTIDLPDDAAAWLGLIRNCTAQIKELEERKLVARQHIERLLGEHEIGQVDGKPAVRWTFTPSSSLDITKLKNERPEIYEAFLRSTVSRRFTLVDPT